MTTDQKIGKKIKELRDSRGLSQQELANALGYKSDSAIYYIEKGERSLPTEKLELVSNYFRISIDELFGLTDESIDRKTSRKDVFVALRSEEGLDEKDFSTINKFIDFLKNDKEDE